MKAVIGATLVASVAAAEPAAKRQLQTMATAEVAGQGLPATGGFDTTLKMKYFFDFSNPAACVRNDAGEEGKAVMSVNGKARLLLKGGRKEFLCSRLWHGSTVLPSSVQTKFTMAPGYALNYTGPDAMGAGGGSGGVSCPSGRDATRETCTAGTGSITLQCKAGFVMNAAGGANLATNTGTCTSSACTYTTQAAADAAQCVNLNECDSSNNHADLTHKCNSNAQCTDVTPGYQCTCNEHPAFGQHLMGRAPSQNFNYGPACTGGTCSGLQGTTNAHGAADVDYPSSGADVYYLSASPNTYYLTNPASGLTLSTPTTYRGCGAHQCTRHYVTQFPTETIQDASGYNTSVHNYTNVTYWSNCSADTTLSTSGASGGASTAGVNCSEPGYAANHSNCTGASRRLLSEISASKRRLSGNSTNTTTTAGSGASAASVLPFNHTHTPAMGGFVGTAAPTGGAGTAKDGFNVLTFDGKHDYAELEAGDMTVLIH